MRFGGAQGEAPLRPGRMTKEYRPKSHDAYQSYLLGRHFGKSMSGDSNRRAIAAYQKAIEMTQST